MPELPYIKWFTNDWIGDPLVTLCSPATRGIWFDFINHMHQHGRTGILSGTREQLARFGRCSASELGRCLTELTKHGVAQVQEADGVLSVENRRMSREFKKRISDAEAKAGKRAVESVRELSTVPSVPRPFTNSAPLYSGSSSDSLSPTGGSAEGGEDFDAAVDWLVRVPKVSVSARLRVSIPLWTLDELKAEWGDVIDSVPAGQRRRGVFCSRVMERKP